MKNKKILPVLGIILLLLTSGGLTYAFLQAQSSAPVTRDVHVLTHTVDMLTFSIDEDISVEATQLNFTNGGDNQDGEATATAILTPNSKTGTATRNYYLYLNIESNPFVYSAANTNHDPELLLQVFDSSDNLVTLTGLGNQVTIDSLTGYDITTARGLKTLLDNHTITASNNATTTQEWRVVVTLVNLDVNQNDNTGKTFEAELIIQENELDLGFTGTIYRNNTRTAFNNHSIEDELTSGWCWENNGVPDCTTPNATQMACEYWGDTCSENNVTVGVGDYETNVNTIRTKTYNVYCPIGGSNLTCGYDNQYFTTEQECLEHINPNTYTCAAGTITKPYYLKHEVENDIIISTEACLWYNNHEFCLGLNYWVGDSQDQVDGTTTKNKLQTAMEAALETQADNCEYDSESVVCIFDGFYCESDANGYVECEGQYDFFGSACWINIDGSSTCTE